MFYNIKSNYKPLSYATCCEIKHCNCQQITIVQGENTNLWNWCWRTEARQSKKAEQGEFYDAVSEVYFCF